MVLKSVPVPENLAFRPMSAVVGGGGGRRVDFNCCTVLCIGISKLCYSLVTGHLVINTTLLKF